VSTKTKSGKKYTKLWKLNQFSESRKSTSLVNCSTITSSVVVNDILKLRANIIMKSKIGSSRLMLCCVSASTIHAVSSLSFVHQRLAARSDLSIVWDRSPLFAYSVSRRKHPRELCMVYAPPNSGYATPEDEVSYFPDEYEPTMEYPGTMRPGRTRENISFQDLPIGDDDPNPVPWPHFQELEFYHVWPAPHPHPELVNDMIEREGRWATPEEEAEMMRDARRGVRLLKELEEAEKKSFVVVDDEDDDDSADDESAVMQRMRDMLTAGATAEGVAAEGVAARKRPKDEAHEIDMDDINFDLDEEDDEEDENDIDEEDDEDDSDFLLDLGLDEDEDDDGDMHVTSLAGKVGTGAIDETAEMDEEDDAGVDLDDALALDDYDDEDDGYFSSDEDLNLDNEAFDDNEGNY